MCGEVELNNFEDIQRGPCEVRGGMGPDRGGHVWLGEGAVGSPNEQISTGQGPCE